ncbi:uncharacterized protein LOC114712590 [Neltuma alba]|uniref:uncharacterized protein LOC114712590 n=1 Tax=Neltuma alba TaxID=207710 RepID=UPI0010A46CBF|nr:uncharacterized protein LOC114712590 [Prosopis alba]
MSNGSQTVARSPSWTPSEGWMKVNTDRDCLTHTGGASGGPKLAWDSGSGQVVLETDATEILRLINEADLSTHVDVSLIEEIKSVRTREWTVVFEHVPRESNQVADLFTKLAMVTTLGYHLIVVAPDVVVEAI